MPTLHSPQDGAVLFYRRYWPSEAASSFRPIDREQKPRPTLVFTAAWPFSSQMYNHLMLDLCESYGYPCILIDRRGFGRSEWIGEIVSTIDYQTFARDLCHIIKHCKIGLFVGIGASLGCGEFLMALELDATLRQTCKGLVFLGPSLPIPLQTERKKTGPPREFWNKLLQDLRDDRWKALSEALPYIFGEKGSQMMSAEDSERYKTMAVQADPMALERTIQIFLANDFTDMLEQRGKTYRFPVLILHGGADAANPVDAGPEFVKKCLSSAEIKVYPDAAHGIAATHKAQCLTDIVEFLAGLTRKYSGQ